MLAAVHVEITEVVPKNQHLRTICALQTYEDVARRILDQQEAKIQATF